MADSYTDIEKSIEADAAFYTNYCLASNYKLLFKRAGAENIETFAQNCLKQTNAAISGGGDSIKKLASTQYVGCAVRDALSRYASRYTLYKKGVDSRFESLGTTKFRYDTIPEEQS